MLLIIIILALIFLTKYDACDVGNIIECCILGLIFFIFAGGIFDIMVQDSHKLSLNSARYEIVDQKSFQISDVDIYVNNETDGFIICTSENFENVSYSVKLDKLERINSDDDVLIKTKLQYKPAGWEYFMFGPLPNMIIKISNDNYLYELRYPFGKYHYITPEILDM